MITLKAQQMKKVVDSLKNLIANIGTTKDKRYYSEWTRKQFAREDLSIQYREDWLSGKIVDIPVDDMTRKWRWYQSGDLKPEQIELIKTLEKEMSVQATFNMVMKWARLYGGAAIVLGIDGAGEMNEELELERVTEGSLKYLIVLDRWDLTPTAVNLTDPTREDFRKPQEYVIANGATPIHHSRIITFEGVSLPWYEKVKESYWGQSILQRVYDAILNAQTVSQATSSLVYESKIDVVKVKNLFRQLSGEGTTAVINRFQNADMVKSINNMLLLDMDEEEYEQKQMTFAGLSDLILRYLNIAAAAADIPATRLLGESAPGLNSTGAEQTRQYYDMVSSQQEMKLRPALEYFDEVLVRSALGYFPDEWQMEFESLWQNSDLEQADIDLKNAQRDQTHIASGNITSSIAVQQLKEDGTYPIEDDYIKALEEIERGQMEAEEERLEQGDPIEEPIESETDPNEEEEPEEVEETEE